jgi:predicted Zn-dependent peptidase
MPADYWDKYAAGINAVTSDQMRKAAENYIALDNALVVVVGDASKIESELRPLCQEVVKFDKNGKRIG